MKCTLVLVLACLASFGSSCKTSAPPSEPARPSAVAAPTPAAPPASVAPPAVDPNRDLHGPPDVAHYIAGLESDARKTDLQVELVVSKLVHDDTAVIADIGCGPGVFSLAFAHAAPKGLVYAVDVEPRQLDRLREHLIEQHLDNVVPVLASYSTPHLPLGACNLIFIGDTYHHLDDRIAYLTNLKRFLARNGSLAILEYKPGRLPVGPPPEHKLAPGVLDRELTEAGFVKSDDFATHPYHDFQVWRVRD